MVNIVEISGLRVLNGKDLKTSPSQKAQLTLVGNFLGQVELPFTPYGDSEVVIQTSDLHDRDNGSIHITVSLCQADFLIYEITFPPEEDRIDLDFRVQAILNTHSLHTRPKFIIGRDQETDIVVVAAPPESYGKCQRLRTDTIVGLAFYPPSDGILGFLALERRQ